MEQTLTERIVKKGKKQKGGGSKKIGRNKVKCAHYRVTRSRKNKLRKLNRHIEIHVNDGCAQKALERV
jgi:hypothetical protein